MPGPDQPQRRHAHARVGVLLGSLIGILAMVLGASPAPSVAARPQQAIAPQQAGPAAPLPTYAPIAQLGPLDPTPGARFGGGAAASGEVLAVAAPAMGGPAGSGQGAVFVFTRNAGGADRWGLVQRLAASDGGAGDAFGWSVALDHDLLAVGAANNDAAGSDVGAVYLYERHRGGPDAWGLLARLTPPKAETSGHFGNGVSLDGDLLVVGAPGVGKAYIFARDQGGPNVWGAVKTLGPIPDYFGMATAVAGDLVAVAATFEGGPGAVHLFRRNQGGADQWGELHVLAPPPADRASRFGAALAFSDGHLAVGAPRTSTPNSDDGAIYLYGQNSGGPDSWGLVRKLGPPDGLTGARFGAALSFEGDRLLAGAPSAAGEQGAAFVFARNEQGPDGWGLAARLSFPADAGDQYGSAVALSDDVALVAAPGADPGASGAGSAAVFMLGEPYWVPRYERQAADGQAGDAFGSTIALDGDLMAVGAPLADAGGVADRGAVYLFGRNQAGPDSWSQLRKLIAPDGQADDRFGTGLALEGDLLAVGAPYADNVGNDGGAVYIFERNAGGPDGWGLVRTLKPSIPGRYYRRFGESVAISGDILVGGAAGADTVWVFERHLGGPDAWGLRATLTGEDPFASYGNEVALDGDTLVVADEVNTVFVHERHQGGPNAWGLARSFELWPPPAAPLAFDHGALALEGDTLAVATRIYGPAWEAGETRIFSRNSGGAGQWGELAALAPDAIVPSQNFGAAVALDGGVVVSGAPGPWQSSWPQRYVQLNGRNLGGAERWGIERRLDSPGGETADGFGEAVALDGANLVVGAPGRGGRRGMVVFYTRTRPATIEAVGGGGQQAEIGRDFAQPLAVLVRDHHGAPLPGLAVEFRTPVHGPSAFFGTGSHSAWATTSSTGVATSPALTSGLVAGPFMVEARISPLAPAAFDLTSTAPPVPGPSPFAAPPGGDEVFSVSGGQGLDTACTYKSGGPLTIRLTVDRYAGDVARLLRAGLISAQARLIMPAYNVNSDVTSVGKSPQRDRVRFNGHVVPGEFLQGRPNAWQLNSFVIPTEWINFPAAPGAPLEAVNTIQIEIDTLSQGDAWCTAIDWASLSVGITPPVLLVHGFASSSSIWNPLWAPRLSEQGLPYGTIELGSFDSMFSNSAKLMTKVRQLRRDWGVDELTIVAKSKGGVDSRQYILEAFAGGERPVGTLVQLGTPNLGTPLADAAYGALGPLVTPIGGTVAALRAPASAELSPSFMIPYTAGASPVECATGASYIALAGSYHFGKLWILPNPLNGLFSAFYGGANDLVVPLRSVHGMPCAVKLAHDTTGRDHDARHGDLQKSAAIYGKLRPLLLGGGPALPGVAAEGEAGDLAAEPPLARAGGFAGTIAAGERQTHSVYVDGGDAASFALYHGAGDLSLALVTPAGRRIDAAAAAADQQLTFETVDDALGLRGALFGVSGPQPGLWQLEVAAAAVGDAGGREPYFITTAISGTDILLSIAADRPFYRSGEPVLLRATLRRGASPQGATVTGQATLPGGDLVSFPLADDGAGDDLAAGDGVYSGRLLASGEPGLYRLAVKATGPVGTPFRREQSLVVTVAPGASHLTGSYADAGLDSGQDGVFEELVVEAQVAITTPGRYRLSGALAGPGGEAIAAAVGEATLAAGTQTIGLHFDGGAIGRRGLDGPYTLGPVRLEGLAGQTPLPLDVVERAHTTASYRAGQFARPALALAGPAGDTARDRDGDGRYDWLEVSVPVTVARADTYTWSGALATEDGRILAFAENLATLDAGARRIVLSFRGETIGAAGADGPFVLADLVIASDAETLVARRVHRTAPYAAASFEGFVARSYLPFVGRR